MTTRDIQTETTPFVPKLAVGNAVKFTEDTRVWDVTAADERWAVLTRQAPFQPTGVLIYTIVDSQTGIRGAANTRGRRWDVQSPGGSEGLLHDLQAGEVQISPRAQCKAVIVEVVR